MEWGGAYFRQKDKQHVTRKSQQKQVCEMWTRPVLCRLCECPVVDGGVRVDQLDAEKLSEWWFCKLNAEFDLETSKDELICQFCLWSARFEYENSNEESSSFPVDWWSGNDDNHVYFKYFYQMSVIKQCSVNLGAKSSIRRKRKKSSKTTSIIAQNLQVDTSTCLYCKARFANKAQVVKHVRESHRDIQTFKCHLCSSYFVTLEEKKRHRERSHLNYKCVYCNTSVYFCSLATLRTHIRDNHKDQNIYQCFITQVCRKYFRTKWEKLNHIRLHHNSMTRHRCFNCKVSFVSPVSLRDHMYSSHPRQFFHCKFDMSFGVCVSVFQTEKEKQEHILQVHKGDLDTKCEFCQKIVYKKSMDLHMRRRHKNEGIPRCSFSRCVTYFRTEEEKQKHEEAVHKSKLRVKCIFCKVLLDKGSYEKHVTSLHESQLPNAFKCTSHCFRYFLTEAERTKHISSEHYKPPVPTGQCIYCLKFFNRSYLKVHTSRVHFDIKIQCDDQDCGEFFLTKSDLDVHVKDHHGDD